MTTTEWIETTSKYLKIEDKQWAVRCVTILLQSIPEHLKSTVIECYELRHGPFIPMDKPIVEGRGRG
jgi:hypothetical protein